MTGRIYNNPRAGIWGKDDPERLDVGCFTDLFYDEIDSAFTADLACCDSCYDLYVRQWPGLKTDLERSSWPLDIFYESSCFNSMYTKEEFLEMCEKMGCPVCGSPLKDNLWPFNPHFDITAHLEDEMEILATVARRTPFLTLRHPLARKALKEITKHSRAVVSHQITALLFRARPIGTPHEPGQFLAPPAAHCGEGRYNHAGCPVLYLASSADVAHAEIGKPENGCAVGSIRLIGPQKVLDLSTDDLPSDILQALTASALMSAPAQKYGWDKPEYIFSRFVADCALNAEFTAIRYPSVESPDDFNVVVLRPEQSWTEIATVESIMDWIPQGRKDSPQ